jgi:hypothetical protein
MLTRVQKEARRVPSEVTIVEEDHSDEEARQRKRRPREREKSIVDEYDAERRPLSPLATQPTRSRSIFPHERYEVARKPAGSSTRSQRRWRERASPVEPVARPWEGPHIIHPRDRDEHVVVTERYVYRPKKPCLDEEGRRRQEHIDRVIMDSRSQTEKSFAQEAASRYYHDDWLRDEPVSVPRAQAQGSRGRGYRRDEYQDSELAESEAGYRNTRAGM